VTRKKEELEMTSTAEKGSIVVGLDGSEGSRRAVDWAAKEAAVRGAALEVVQAWTAGEFGDPRKIGEFHEEKLVEAIAGMLHDPGLEWTAVVEEGSAAKVLLNRAKSAEMLVVGSRGHGALAGLALGSVGIQVATHDSAPVVVIVRR